MTIGVAALISLFGCNSKATPDPEISNAAKAQLESYLAALGQSTGGTPYDVMEASCDILGFDGDGYSTHPSDDLPGNETSEGCGQHVRISAPNGSGNWTLREYAKQLNGEWVHLEGDDTVGPVTRDYHDVCVDGTSDVGALPRYCPQAPKCIKQGNQFRCCRDISTNTVECIQEWFWDDGWASEGCGYKLGTKYCFELTQ